MSQFFDVHPDNPQIRLLRQAAQILHDGGLAAVPTDSSYAFVCHLDDKEAVDKLRRVRGVDDKHHLTLLCRDLSHPSRRTIGLRVPDHKVLQALLAELGQPLLATTLIPPGETLPLNDPEEIRARFEKSLQAIVCGGACPMEPTTVIDLTGDEPVLVREGRGNAALLG